MRILADEFWIVLKFLGGFCQETNEKGIDERVNKGLSMRSYGGERRMS